VRSADELARLVRFYRLAGRLDEYRELMTLLGEHPGLTVVSADPWSGTSLVLDAVADHLQHHCVVADARPCGALLDLSVAIADKAVVTLAKPAAAWWVGGAPAPSAAGLRLAKELVAEGIEYERLRAGAGHWDAQLADAVRLTLVLARAPVTLVIDHLGGLLASLAASEARELLGALRALRAAHPDLDLVLVEHPDGATAEALSDRAHPLYQAGDAIRIRRPDPARYAFDLEETPWRDDPELAVLPEAAELVAGVPALAWQIVELAQRGATSQERARDGWLKLRAATAPSVARQWDTLRRVHPLAQAVVAAIASGLGPHAVDANSKSITDALRRLRDLGMAWQPLPRSWRLADPLLVEWAHHHRPPWVRHRRQLLG
jgi:hypothetical protein